MTSGNDIERKLIGDPETPPPCIDCPGEDCEAATTSRLNPAPNLPEKAVNAELTDGPGPL
jgi:hypothetical protein